MKLAWDDSIIKLGCCDRCGRPLNTLERISDKALGCSLKWWPRLVEACLTVMTVDHRNELLVMDHSMMVVALRLMVCMNYNSYASLALFFIIHVLFCFVFQHETLYILCKSWLCLILIL